MTICCLALQKGYLGLNRTFLQHMLLSLGIQIEQSPSWWVVEQWSPRCLKVCEQDVHYRPSYNLFPIFFVGEKILLSLPWYCYNRKTSPWSGVNDYSVQEGGLEISVAKMGPQDESKAWGKDSARGPHGERSLKTVVWNEEEKFPLPKRSFGQFSYYYCTKKHLPKQDTEQWFLQLDRLFLMPSEVWVFWWAPELIALYKTLLRKILLNPRRLVAGL